jgi:glycosyltransferase involved in cell wall biosynthesis
MPPLLSAILIVRNEERDLPACLESLKGVVDETVVVDSGSTDHTVPIAQRFGARVIHRDFMGFGPQKQFALEQATGEWVINIDADERLSPALGQEIRAALSSGPAVNGFHLRFHNMFLGRRLRFGGHGANGISVFFGGTRPITKGGRSTKGFPWSLRSAACAGLFSMKAIKTFPNIWKSAIATRASSLGTNIERGGALPCGATRVCPGISFFATL